VVVRPSQEIIGHLDDHEVGRHDRRGKDTRDEVESPAASVFISETT
jgi:hypothetical protein